jgi:hypothetical protein
VQDLLLLSNFVRASPSFRLSESFSPVCLPHYNPAAFLHTYIAYLDPEVKRSPPTHCPSPLHVSQSYCGAHGRIHAHTGCRTVSCWFQFSAKDPL